MINYNMLLFMEDQKQLNNIISIIKSYGINTKIKIETSKENALEIIKKEKIDIFLCENIPSAIELLESIKQNDKKILSIMFAKLKELNFVINCINDGLIYHFIVTPYNYEYVREILRQAIMQIDNSYHSDLKLFENKQMLEYKQKITEEKNDILDAYMSMLEIIGKEIYIHSVQVSNIAVGIAEKLCLSPEIIHDIRIAGFLHDIGKISVKDSILNKPGKLDIAETNEMQEHPTKSYLMLKNLNGMEKISKIVYQHHERVDGSGYPLGLSGNDIMLEARILAVADTFNALISDRIYRRGLERYKALEILKRDIHLYDENIIEILLTEN